LPATPGEPPAQVEIESQDWWLNKDQRGGIWINGRARKKGSEAQPGSGPAGPEAGAAAESSAQAPAEPSAASPVSSEAPAAGPDEPKVPSAGHAVLALARPLLKETKTGAFAEETGQLANALGKTGGELLAALTSAGLSVPEKPRARPVFVEHAGELFWLNKNAKDELWLNAKAPKYAAGEEHKRRRGKRPAISGESSAPAQP
jgi:hypothetical protein